MDIRILFGGDKSVKTAFSMVRNLHFDAVAAIVTASVVFIASPSTNIVRNLNPLISDNHNPLRNGTTWRSDCGRIRARGRGARCCCFRSRRFSEGHLDVQERRAIKR